MKKRIVLFILLFGILFPFAALVKFSESYASVFNYLFNSLLAHILMHGVLFASLSWIVMSFFQKQSMMRIFQICLGSVLIVALVQEGIQMLSTGTSDFGAALFDLGIDLTAGAIPPLLKWIIMRRKSRSAI